MQKLEEPKSKQTSQTSQDRTTIECPPIDEDIVWSQTVGDPYKGRIYGMGRFYSDSLSPTSMTGDVLDRSDQVEEAIHTHIHALNEELHRRLQQQEQRFWEKEAKLKKKLKTVERRVGKKTERRIMRQMQKYFQDLWASISSLPPPQWLAIPDQQSSSSSCSSSATDDEDGITDTDEQAYSQTCHFFYFILFVVLI